MCMGHAIMGGANLWCMPNKETSVSETLSHIGYLSRPLRYDECCLKGGLLAQGIIL